MHCLSLVLIIKPLHVLGASAVHHQEVECIHVANCACYTTKLTVILPPDDGQLMRPKHVHV
jgi:hypothetical protein